MTIKLVNTVLSTFSPLSPSLINPPTSHPIPIINLTTQPPQMHSPPLLGSDHNLIIDPTPNPSLHVGTSNSSPQMILSAPAPPLIESHSLPAPATSSSEMHVNHSHPPPKMTSGLNPTPTSITEVFRCSAPDFNGEDDAVIFDTLLSLREASSYLPLSNANQQQLSGSKKRSSSSSDSNSSGGGGGVSALN